MKPFNI